MSNIQDYTNTAEGLRARLYQDKGWVKAVMSKKCNTCRNLDPRGHPQAQLILLGDDVISALKLGLIDFSFRSKKCGYCDLIFRALDPFLSTYLEDPYARVAPQVSSITMIERQPTLLSVDAWPGGEFKTFNIEIYQGSQSKLESLPALGTANDVSEKADSDECFAFIQDCLRDCLEHHKNCVEPIVILPKRVLHLEGPQNSSRSPNGRNVRIRLQETSSLEENGSGLRYAALSHCWGLNQIPLRTMTGNISDLQRGIDWTDLSRTFQDAVVVSLKLGLTYLWIDSLCIIQDDGDDWDVEAAKMGGIYANAILTIAASSSSAGSIPFLKPRPPEITAKDIRFYGPRKNSIPVRAFRSLIGPKAATIKVRQTSQGAGTQGDTAGWTQIGSASNHISGPLSTRCWTLQERVLSTRIVHFTDEGLRWECRESSRHEDGRVCLPSYLQEWNRFKSIRPQYSNIATNAQRSELQALWRDFVTDYMKRKITKRTDLLPALSGIASRMQSLHHSPYLAGLWKDQLIEDLCWQPSITWQDSAPPTHPDDINLPTWSWISIRHPIEFVVTYEKGTFTPHSRVLECHCTLSGSNPFGTVTDGTLLVEGPFLEASLQYPGQVHDATPFLREPLRGRLLHDAPLVADTLTTPSGETTPTIRRARTNEPLDYLDGKVWGLDLGQWVPTEMGPALAGVERWFILVLAPSVRVQGAYERIGICESSFFYADELWKAAPVSRVRIC